MKIVFAFVFGIAVCCASTAVSAQSNSLGEVLVECVDGISEDAFKNRFDREAWKSNSANLGSLDIADAKDQLSGLVRDMKGRAFANRSKGDVVREILGVNNTQGIKAVLSKFLSALKPDMLKDGFNPEQTIGKLEI
ncbi:MAG: hypothetical protein LC664_02310 [Flavobacteriales bacterium]|nr:hypothetical protein [Flavobacteriales bacterium]